MHRLSFTHRFVQIIHYLGGRHHIRYAHTLTFLFQGRLGAHPDDIVDGQFIPENNFPVFIDIDQSRKTGIIRTEKI